MIVMDVTEGMVDAVDVVVVDVGMVIVEDVVDVAGVLHLLWNYY